MKGGFAELSWHSIVYLTESVRQIICRRWDQILMHLPYWCQRKHNAYVMATVPKENLLVWNLKEGWEPLCKFLNKPIPSEPIPHDNRTGDKEFMERYILNKPIFKEVWIRNHIHRFTKPIIIFRLEQHSWEKLHWTLSKLDWLGTSAIKHTQQMVIGFI